MTLVLSDVILKKENVIASEPALAGKRGDLY
jgi:hypothetical protein